MSRSRSWSPSEEPPKSSMATQMSDSDFEDGESVNDSDLLNEMDDDLNCDSAISSSTRSSDASIADQIKKASVGTVNKSVLRDESPLSKTNASPLVPSLFPNVPPSIHFCGYDQMHEQEPQHGLKWQLTRLTPVVVRRIVANAGFELVPIEAIDNTNGTNDENTENGNEETPQWAGAWGLHLQRRGFESLSTWQKVNHFPGGGNLARKDRLWRHHKHWRQLQGKESFGFIPECFIWPQEANVLREYWIKKGSSAKWIIKPPAKARGDGISVVSKWRQIPPELNLVVQEYIARPHLVKNRKYDLRLYVLVTSLEPLRVYLHDEGLVRFASRPYDSQHLSDLFMHLTNFSVNRANEDYFVEAEEISDRDEEERGHKWRLSTLWRHFQQELNIDHRPIWAQMKAMVVKTLISVLKPMRKTWRRHVRSHYNCYELFGFDVLLDQDLRPWMLEVNLSPSLHSSSHLDLGVKGAVVAEMLNLVRFHPADERVPKLYSRSLEATEMEKQRMMLEMQADSNFDVSLAILDSLTHDDIRHLIRAEDELVLATNFERIFPPVLDQNQQNDEQLIDLMEPNYYDLLLHAWERKYGHRRYEGVEALKLLCTMGAHLQ